MASISVSIEFDREFERQLETLRYPHSSIKRILKRAGRQVIDTAKREYMRGGPGRIQRRSGRLQKSLKRDDSQLANNVVGVTANEIYASVHEFGATIRPVRKPFLRFQLPDGRWRSARQVRIPARPFLNPALEDFRREAEAFFDREIQRELARGLRA